MKEGTGFEVNPAYDLMEEDAFSFGSVLIMVLFIILAGYLIIYNIFNISIKTDIRAYGLLKNVGATGKRLKKIVRMQAWYLSAAGIPIGLFLGYASALLMAPSLTASAEISAEAGSKTETVVSAHPLIFVGAGIFTLLTVYLSSIQACRMVERVSPVEALKLADGEQTKRKIKKNTPVIWWGMAAGNMLRNWKKGLIVMLSVALSMVVVDCIVMMVNGYDFDAYKETAKANEERRTDYEKGLWEEAKSENRVKVHLIGVSRPVFEKLEWKESPCSWEGFESGDYVITDFNVRYTSHQEDPESFYETGDTFSMEYESGKKKEYKVLGEALMPYSLDYPFTDCVYLTVIVPEEEFIKETGKDHAMYAAIDVKKGTEKKSGSISRIRYLRKMMH